MSYVVAQNIQRMLNTHLFKEKVGRLTGSKLKRCLLTNDIYVGVIKDLYTTLGLEVTFHGNGSETNFKAILTEPGEKILLY